ncbi:MAG TPA: FmdB family zinc ribbon protein [Acidimicrobiales bacterium]|nr:FmdB family zinc ribbon protein [Acidimicrobiales bacterium]
MPKYEYACKSCGERLELVQSFNDAPLTECPACGGSLRKVFSAPAITFKGSGFYRTDNRTGRAASEPKADAKADAKADTSSNGKAEPAKTESAPAAESKPKAAEAKSA